MMRCGARGSRLSVAQASSGIAFLSSRIKGFKARLITFNTPGDRDLATPIERSAPDFFTRDLDTAVRDGLIDFALHSAKDLPERMADDLDWFWLPDRADARDCWVGTKASLDCLAVAAKRNVGRALRIGVSSARRAAYAKACCPRAKLVPIRGAIDARLRQVAEGKFDAVLMAMAGLKRLYPNFELDGLPLKVQPIPLEELPPPEGQGFLAVVFRRGDDRFMSIRREFVKAVRFTSAGVGDAGLITVRGAQDLEESDSVLADSLSGFGEGRFSGAAHGNARWVDVGKRCGAHSMAQEEVTRLICDEVRKGKRVVRLKGGDAGLFGRLAEETAALDALGIPYLVRPGVSALTAATAPNGILLTKRGEARGFAVSTPRSKGTKTPQVFFMATKMARDELKRFPPEEPYAMVWDACGAYERIETGVCGRARLQMAPDPGLLVVGYAGTPLLRKRVLLTCSPAVLPRAVCRFEDRGWLAVAWPMISLKAREGVTDKLAEKVRGADVIVLTSPSSVRIFFAEWGGDRRMLPAFWTCGAGTDAELRRYGVVSDMLPERDFSSKGLIARLRLEGAKLKGLRVLRLRSAKAGRSLAAALRRLGASVEDLVLYDTVPVRHSGPLPPHDAAFFASASAVEFYLAAYGAKALCGKDIYVMGEPTRAALPLRFRRKSRITNIAREYYHE